jgi:chemotaxis protein CheX
MNTPFSLDTYRDDLSRIVQSVFRTMMDLETAPSDSAWAHQPAIITAAVHFVGEWQGAATVECNTQQACQFAARFMGIELPAAVDSDVRDVMGELANMVAGNLKSLLPRGVNLSMPCVVEGTNYTVHECGATAVEHMTFSSATGDFRVTLIETAPRA